MNTFNATAGHPSNQDLAAFALGKPTSQSAETIANHLEKCSQCERVLSETPRDTLLGILKSAKPGSSLTGAYRMPEPNATLSGSIAAAPIDPDELPEDLKNQTKYKFLKKLGSGGMGMVYLAEHVMMQRKVAIKLLPAALADKPDIVARFINEIVSAAKLEHQNVVRAYSTERVGKHILLEMEYVDGKDLGAVVEKKGPLPITNAIAYIRQAATGLNLAFQLKMVHRDIKPRNLMLTRGGQVKIADFGLAKFSQEQNRNADGKSLTGDNAVMGTPDYMAPEQARDAKNVDIRADIYSLGCTLYYLLTGKPPFTGTSAMELIFAHVEQQVPDVRSLRPEVSAKLAEFVKSMMSKRAEDRPQTPRDVIDQLNKIEKDTAQPQPVPKPILPTVADTGFVEMTSANPQPAPQALGSSLPKRILAVAATVLVIYGLLAASGIIKLKTPRGTIVLEVNEPGAEVSVDGKVMTVTWDNGKQRAEITVSAGQPHMIEVTKAGFKATSETVEVSDKGRSVFKANLIAKAPIASKPLEPSTIKKEWLPLSKEPTPITVSNFKSLFDGKTLNNWFVESGDTAQWKVEDGVILGRSTNSRTRNYLLSNEEYSEYVLRFDFKIASKSSAGIALMAVAGEKMPINAIYIADHPIIKITDTENFPNEPLGTTHWLKDSRLSTKPEVELSMRSSQWYSAEITISGKSCKAIVDSRKIIDFALDSDPANYLGAIPGLKRTKGKIGFQAHTGEIRFRNIEIQELKDGKPIPTDGFAPLFNGKDLTGWNTKNPTTWNVIDGVLTGTGAVSHLFTDRSDYKDFHVRVSARVNANGNSGVYGRSKPQSGRFYPQGYEANILDSNIADDRTGALYLDGTLLNRVPRSLVAADEWFDMEMIVRGKQIRVLVNGIESATGLDSENRYTQGAIALEVHDANTKIEFRKVEIKE